MTTKKKTLAHPAKDKSEGSNNQHKESTHD
jgi:hypothetical protein